MYNNGRNAVGRYAVTMLENILSFFPVPFHINRINGRFIL